MANAFPFYGDDADLDAEWAMEMLAAATREPAAECPYCGADPAEACWIGEDSPCIWTCELPDD